MTTRIPPKLTTEQALTVATWRSRIVADAIRWIGESKHPTPAAKPSLTFTAIPHYARAVDDAHARAYSGDPRMIWLVQANGQTVATYRSNLDKQDDPRRDDLVIWWR